MARYCDGELGAFLRLYQATAPRILTYLATLTADAALARELLQETYLRLHGIAAPATCGAPTRSPGSPRWPTPVFCSGRSACAPSAAGPSRAAPRRCPARRYPFPQAEKTR